MIHKALIACGGWSTRFLPAVKTYAKQLVPVLDKPQIHWVIEELIGAGITDIAINVRENETSLQRHFTPDTELNTYLESTGKQKCLDGLNNILSKAKLHFFFQTKDFPYGNGTPILVAKDFIGSDPFVYLWGDDLTIEDHPGAFLSQIIATYEQYQPAVIIGTQEVPWPEVYRYGTVKFQPDPQFPGRISALTEKLPEGQAPSNFIQGGRFVCSPKIPATIANTPQQRGELWFADAVNTLAQTDIALTLNYQEHHATWITTGDPQNWLKANLILALKDPALSEPIRSFLQTQKP
jgi:UTP--glucose-1-phosphate uridylyltransferase